MDILVPFIKEIRFKRNADIIIPGGEPPGVYLIIEGCVEIYSCSADKKLIVELLGPGEVLGYEYFISEDFTDQRARAVETSKVYLVPKEIFLFLLKHNEAFRMNMLDELCHRLATAQERMSEIAYQPVRQRIVKALLYLNDVHKDQGENFFDGNRTVIGQIAAVRRETATKVVKELEQEGLVDIHGEMVRIIERNALLEILNPKG